MKQVLPKITSAVVIPVVLLLGILVGIAWAQSVIITQTWVAGAEKSTSTVRGTPEPEWGWPNVTIPGAVSRSTGGLYRVMSNYWYTYTAIAGSDYNPVTIEMTVDDKTGEFVVTKSPNSHFPNGRNGACHTSDPECKWTPDNGHAPAAYPSIYKGCHWGQCSGGGGKPFPMRVTEIASIPSTWTVDLGQAGTITNSAFNVAYDIWLDKNLSGYLPDKLNKVNQNDGTEIMIWMNNRGYDAVNSKEDPIRPAGKLALNSTTVPGIPGTWDVWVEPAGGNPMTSDLWRIVSYVREDRVETMTFDSKLFIEHAMTLDCNTDTLKTKCIKPEWWLTSIQAGFEIWANGKGLSSKVFTVEPVAVSGGVTGDARTADGKPVVYWAEPFTLKTAGCTKATAANFVLTPASGTAVTGSLTEKSADSGAYEATIGPLKPLSGNATIKTSLTCPDGTINTKDVSVFIKAEPAAYVKQGANGAKNGLSWQDAYPTLQDALANVSSGEIWVAKGVYYPDEGGSQTNDDRAATFQLKDNVAIYGGFTGDETSRDKRNVTANVTVLSGDLQQNDKTEGNIVQNPPHPIPPTSPTNPGSFQYYDVKGNNAYHVVSARNVTRTAILDGFTITAGVADGSNTQGQGGGMRNDNASPTLLNLSFQGNWASVGGGISNHNRSMPVIEKTTFSGNAARSGGGLYNDHAYPTIDSTVFSGNWAYKGGAMMTDESGGILENGEFVQVRNSTFAGNYTNQYMHTSGAVEHYRSVGSYYNCIMWGNSYPASTVYEIESMLSFRKSNVEGCKIGYQGDPDDCGLTTYGGNISENPSFAGPVSPSSAPTTTGNYRLQKSSPVINAGSNFYAFTSLDRDNKSRVAVSASSDQAIVDMGAYEFSPESKVYLPLILQ